MRRHIIMTLAAGAALGACEASNDNKAQNAAVANVAEPAATMDANGPDNLAVPSANAGQPVPPPLVEPTGPIDPKSAEAAGQVVQTYGALIEQGRWTESWRLWSNPAAAKQFDRNWRDDRSVHLTIGELGEPEGAAGSIYISEPVTFYGKTKDGGSFRRRAEVVLRRVNDVPGSTAAQRRWHIERIDWK